MATEKGVVKGEKIAYNKHLDSQVQLLMKREQLSEDDVEALCAKVCASRGLQPSPCHRGRGALTVHTMRPLLRGD